MDVKNLLRGKYELSFFILYVDRVKDEFRRRKKPGERRRIIDFPIAAESIFPILANELTEKLDAFDFLLEARDRFGLTQMSV